MLIDNTYLLLRIHTLKPSYMRFTALFTTFTAGFGELWPGTIGKVAWVGMMGCGCEPADKPGCGVMSVIDDRGGTKVTLHFDCGWVSLVDVFACFECWWASFFVLQVGCLYVFQTTRIRLWIWLYQPPHETNPASFDQILVFSLGGPKWDIIRLQTPQQLCGSIVSFHSTTR